MDAGRRVRAFPGLFADSLRRMATCDHPRVAVRNMAIGGAGANYFASCVNRHVEDRTNLTLVELNANYGSIEAFERVLRKLLQHRPPQLPIVVQLGTWLPNRTTARRAREVLLGRDEMSQRNAVALHYGVPIISQPAALQREVRIRPSIQHICIFAWAPVAVLCVWQWATGAPDM